VSKRDPLIPGTTVMRIVLLDDDRAFLRSTELLLGARGHQVKGFSNALDAREGMAAEAPDILLIDFVLPGVSGFEVLDWLGQDGTRPPCIIMVSGHEDRIEKGDLARAGVSAFLPKPVDLDELVCVLEQHCRPGSQLPV